MPVSHLSSYLFFFKVVIANIVGLATLFFSHLTLAAIMVDVEVVPSNPEPGDTVAVTTTVTCTGPLRCAGNFFFGGGSPFNDGGDITITGPVSPTTIPLTPLFDIIANGTVITFSDTFTVSATATQGDAITVTADFNGSCEEVGTPFDCSDSDTIFLITTPVTLSSFSSIRSGSYINIDWSTSSELFNVGFQLWGLDGTDGKWEKLHNWLVKSGSGNAVEPQSYSKTARIPSSVKHLVAVGISNVDSDGSEHYYGPFNVGQSYGNLGTFEPIAWNHIRDEVDSSMESKGYVKDRVNGYRKITASQALNSSDTDTVVEFNVNESGMYRITSAELLTAGIDWRDVRNGDIALLDHTGRAQVRFVWARGEGRGLNKTLGDKGEVYFYGEPPSEAEGIYTDVTVYRLVLDRYQALKAQTQPKQGVQTGYSEYYIEHVEMETDALYVLNSAADDPWLSQVILSYPEKPRSYGVQIPVEADARWDRSATLSLGLGRSSALTSVDSDNNGVQDPEHRVDGLVLSSGEIINLGTETATGSGEWDVSFEIPSNTPLSITNGHVLAGGAFSANSGYTFSEIHVDSIGLSYARPYVAKGDDRHLLFKAPNAGEAGYEVIIPDQGWPWVFASDGSNLVRIGLESQTKRTGAEGEKQRVVRFSALNQIGDKVIQYWVSGKSGYLTVEGLTLNSLVSPDALLAQTNGANYLLVAHPSFMGDTLSNYAAFKQSQGYGVSIVNYLDIVDVFGGGQPGPAGLTRFLSEIEALQDIDHVLIVGGSVYDHTDILQTGALTFIPGHYGQSNYSQYTVSDVPYITDAEGGLFADIGRWPVRSTSDLETIVAKSIQWATTDHTNGSALLIAEHTVAGEEIDFAQALDGISQALPESYSQTRVYVDNLIEGDPDDASDDLTVTTALAQAKGEIIAQLNNSPDVVLYNGHASTRQLSNQNLFKSGDINQVSASGAEVWLPMSCYVTFYESTHVNTLAHQLLFSGNAMNITGAMLLSNQSGNLQMGASILDATMNSNATLGAAVNQAKAAQNNPKLDINWALLGDPTTKF